MESAFQEGHRDGLKQGYEMGLEKHALFHQDKERFKLEWAQQWLPKIMNPFETECPYINGHHQGFIKGLTQAFKDQYQQEYIGSHQNKHGHVDGTAYGTDYVAEVDGSEWVCDGNVCYKRPPRYHSL